VEQSGEDKQVIVAWQVVCLAEVLLFLSSESISLIPSCKNVISVALSGFQGGCKVNGSEQRQIQSGKKCQALFLLLFIYLFILVVA
jgi:hypothetical protein